MPILIQHGNGIGEALGAVGGGVLSSLNQQAGERRGITQHKELATFDAGVRDQADENQLARRSAYDAAKSRARIGQWQKIAPQIAQDNPGVNPTVLQLIGGKWAERGYLDDHDLQYLGTVSPQEREKLDQAWERNEAMRARLGMQEQGLALRGQGLELQGQKLELDKTQHAATLAQRASQFKQSHDLAVKREESLAKQRDTTRKISASGGIVTQEQKQRVELAEKRLAYARKRYEDALAAARDDPTMADAANRMQVGWSLAQEELEAVQQEIIDSQQRFAPGGQSQQPNDQPVQVQTPADAQKLAPGTIYITPDGKKYRR